MHDEVAVEKLTKVYEQAQGWRQRGEPVTAVSQVTLNVPKGELFGLLGPNGAGKTTLVKMLCTLILPSGGRGTIAGHDLRQTGAIRAVVGLVVSDERSFYWRLTARRNLLFFAAMHGLYGRAAHDQVAAVLAAVGLTDAANRRFSNFSSGMRQRLAIARALLHRPQILFLDEPSRSLDPTATRRLHDLIRQLQAQQEMTIFLITHDLAEAEKLCDRVALMHQGKIRATGQPAELRRQLRPQQRYQVQVAELETAVLAELRALHSEIHYQAQQLTFRAGANDGLLTAVLGCLHRHAIPVLRIAAAPPSLEEVFAYYTRE